MLRALVARTKPPTRADPGPTTKAREEYGIRSSANFPGLSPETLSRPHNQRLRGTKCKSHEMARHVLFAGSRAGEEYAECLY